MRSRLILVLLAALAGAGALLIPQAVSSRADSDPCAAMLPAQTTVSSRSGANAAIVPDGATGITVCQYGVSAPSQGGATGITLTAYGSTASAATVAQLAGELNALQPQGPYPIACPADFGGSLIASFTYPSGPADPVTVELGGCESVSNGVLNRLGLDSAAPSQLAALATTKVTTRSTTTPSPPTNPASGTLVVRSLLCGGAKLPHRPACRVGALSSCTAAHHCMPNDHITVSLGGRVAARAQLRAGRFSLTLAPGRYRVAIGTGHRIVQRTRATVRAGRTTHITFRFELK